MTKYAINAGNPHHLEEKKPFKTYAAAVSEFTRLKHLGLYEAAELVKLHYNDGGYCCRMELKKSFGLPVSGKTKLQCPRPILSAGGNGGGYAWLIEHDTIGIRIWENSQAKCIEAFWEAVEKDYGDVKCIKYRDEWFY